MRDGMNINRGDVVLIPFPFSDLTSMKKRPALVISNDCVNSSNDRICCPVTSKQPVHGIKIDSLSSGSLPLKSWIKTNKILTVSKNLVTKKFGTISQSQQDRVFEEVINLIK